MRNYKELLIKICWSLFLLAIIGLGQHLYVPVFNIEINHTETGNLIIDVISSAIGGRLNQPTLFSLGIGPNMTAMIVWSTISMIDIDAIKNLSIKQSGYIIRILTVIFAILQSIVFVLKFEEKLILYTDGPPAIVVAIAACLIITAGAMIIAWLADFNILWGIGGQSLFIIPGLLTNLPTMILSGHDTTVTVSYTFIVFILVISLFYGYMTIFMHRSEYRIRIQRTSIDSPIHQSYIPIRLLTAGAMPFMFAVSVFSIPRLLFVDVSWVNETISGIVDNMFSFNTVAGIIIYCLILYLLGIGFTFINVRPYDIAKNLKESGDYIINFVPGEQTEAFIHKKVMQIALLGNSYLVIVSIIPLLIGLKHPLILNLAFYFGSLYMLIIIIDNIIQEIQFIYTRKNYDVFE